MPELPEVENIKRQLSSVESSRILRVWSSQFKLRYNLIDGDVKLMQIEQPIIKQVTRLGRYLLFKTTNFTLVIHLGMTGNLRLDTAILSNKKHDHIAFELQHPNGDVCHLIYNDTRRFGGAWLIQSIEDNKIQSLLNLGQEPTAPIHPEIIQKLYATPAPIKCLLMNNALITGIGNIYANEICHDCHIDPRRAGNSLSINDCRILSESIDRNIQRAIKHGGSTFRNYVNLDGEKGGAQQFHRVYGLDKTPCSRCLSNIASLMLMGRNTFYCPNCQF